MDLYLTDNITELHSMRDYHQSNHHWLWSKSSLIEIIFSNGDLKDSLDIIKFVPR